MKPVVHLSKSTAITYDAQFMDAPAARYFSVDFWKSKNAVSGEAVGRGSAWFIDTPQGPVVLRRYLRGGWVALLSHHSYLFTTVARSRPFREFHILAALHQRGLPVPQPVAALCRHRGVISSGAIVTVRISSARTLADLLPEGIDSLCIGLDLWASVGQCVRRFHDAGVWHADLNARNLLLDDECRVFLIDFDRARYTPGRPVRGEGNLKRLKRSLVKLWPVARLSELKSAWARIEAAYHA